MRGAFLLIGLILTLAVAAGPVSAHVLDGEFEAEWMMGPGHSDWDWDNSAHPGAPGYPMHWDDPRMIMQGTPFALTGEVIETNAFFTGGALVLATAGSRMTLFGLGPFWYWESLGLDRPAAGDTITAEGYTLDFNGMMSNILMAVTLDDGTRVQLRDQETGWPLWHQPHFSG